jgi:hypothetical protein
MGVFMGVLSPIGCRFIKINLDDVLFLLYLWGGGWGRDYNGEKFQGGMEIGDNIAIGLFIFCFIECLFPYLCGVIT